MCEAQPVAYQSSHLKRKKCNHKQQKSTMVDGESTLRAQSGPENVKVPSVRGSCRESGEVLTDQSLGEADHASPTSHNRPL